MLTYNDEKLYDLSTIEMFCHGNQNAVKEMVGVFINEVSGLADTLRSAYTTNDFRAIRNAIHKIKPVISYCAIPTVENEFSLINESAKGEEKNEEIELRINRLETIVKEVVAHMTKTVLQA